MPKYIPMLYTNSPCQSILEISQQVKIGSDFFLLLGGFLDRFYHADQIIRTTMLADAPETNLPFFYHGPFLAATAHKLANDHHLTPSPWVFEDQFFLPGDQPYFDAWAYADLRLVFMVESPPEFKFRNLFASKDVLTRV